MARIEFKGKAFVQNYHMQVKYHELIPVKSKSLTDKVSLNDNLIIHGDNLIALKALLPMYAGKVKCIYIDPPYNTGNENWAYNDNVNSPMMQEWLGKVVDKEDLTRHDKWLCMMMPRLKLLKELLAEDGVIFASIDNNEVHRLRSLFDEVFCGNYVSHLVWKGKSGAEDDDYYRTINEHILCYAKNKDLFMAGRRKKEGEKFPKYDERKKRHYKTQLARKWGSNSRREDRPNLYYSINAPDGTKAYPMLPDGNEGCWRWSETRMVREIKEGNIEFEKKNKQWIIYQKLYAPKEGEEAGTKKYNTWLDDVGSTSTGTDEIKALFGEKVFDHPKPVTLITRLLKMAGLEEEDIVLDSFAGSGTTAQAVMELNQNEGMNLKYILVQLPEDIEKKHISYKLGFRKVIEITRERLVKRIKGVSDSSKQDYQEGIDSSFSYFEIGKAIKMEEILTGKNMPSYEDLSRYVFYTATGEEFDPKAIKADKNFIGESREYLVYLFYQPDLEYLKATALTMERAKKLGEYKNKRRLVFAPTKYLDQEHLDALRIDFAQLPFEIYRLAK